MSEKEKKELNENELEKAAGGVVFGDHCDKFESKHSGGFFLASCSECKHFTQRGGMSGACEFGQNVYLR